VWCCNISERNGIACFGTEGCEEWHREGKMALCREGRSERHTHTHIYIYIYIYISQVSRRREVKRKHLYCRLFDVNKEAAYVGLIDCAKSIEIVLRV
jgi:hypothetical protein